MAPPGGTFYRPLMAPPPGLEVTRTAHVELRNLLWAYTVMLAVLLVVLQND
jgi:hypothetical protein